MKALPLNDASAALSDGILVDRQLDDLDILVRPIKPDIRFVIYPDI